jgi:hypothetical protein
MSTTPRDKSSGRPRQRSRKADQRGQKPEQQQNPKVDQRHEEEIGSMVTSSDAPTNGAATLPDVPLIGEVAPADAPSIATAAPAANHEISLQTIANEYGDYTKKSFQETRSFVEKLMGVRSFDKAIELQTEFARQAYANFVAESQKICELYSELAKRVFSAAMLTQAGR